MRPSRPLAGLGLLLLSLAASRPLEAAPRVSFELVTGNGFPLTAQRKWIDLFKNLPGTTVRIRGARGSETTTVEDVGTSRSPSYHVVGILLGDNRLRLLGGEFSANDRTKLAAWVKKLRAEGVEGLTAVRVAFGLTSDQLVAFHAQASRPIPFTTKDVRSGDVARQIVRQVAAPFEVSAAGRAAFGRNELVADELKGLSCGTALAATIRPLGLTWRPRRRDDGKTVLVIEEAGTAEESWPVGWPVKGTPYSTAPKLFENLKVEIRDTPLSEAIEAIQPRVELPFLFDHNSMARHQVDPAASKVDFPAKRASYKRILDTVMFQAGLSTELRLDEADRPFLWISTTKR